MHTCTLIFLITNLGVFLSHPKYCFFSCEFFPFITVLYCAEHFQLWTREPFDNNFTRGQNFLHNLFEMAAMPFPCNAHLFCFVNIPTVLLMFFNKFASCSIPYFNLFLYFTSWVAWLCQATQLNLVNFLLLKC